MMCSLTTAHTKPEILTPVWCIAPTAYTREPCIEIAAHTQLKDYAATMQPNHATLGAMWNRQEYRLHTTSEHITPPSLCWLHRDTPPTHNWGRAQHSGQNHRVWEKHDNAPRGIVIVNFSLLLEQPCSMQAQQHQWDRPALFHLCVQDV